ncbi:hypothetical protein BRAS3843_1480053 [Bradyrhizobium sp. STM 3843]|uniref:hypothetical protein n=1 Tax=Bradyrhizobium sp. STM 3843 TaxID=551947 RepID=UPI0002406BC0|nr:hypothetical protein [Bradyrhizobium sp. STM 3843]CCE05822.1 hypothetical protein BRAS3843_1480053 [Bradyrhizobium sp. STM 3843]
MIDRQAGQIIWQCDSCEDVLETGTPDFDDARAIMQRKQWKAQKIGRDWIHACPECEIDR